MGTTIRILITLVVGTFFPLTLYSATYTAQMQRARNLGKPVFLKGAPDQALVHQLQQIQQSHSGHQGNILAVLFYVFRESIEDNNKDKKYFLARLKALNDIADALGDYLNALADVSRDLGQRGKSHANDEKLRADFNLVLAKIDRAAARFQRRLNTSRRLSTSDRRKLHMMLQRDRRMVVSARSVLGKVMALRRARTRKVRAPVKPHKRDTNRRAKPVIRTP